MADRQSKSVPQSEVAPPSPQSHSVFEPRGFGDPIGESPIAVGPTASQTDPPALQTQLDRSARLGHHFSAVASTPSPSVQPQFSPFQASSPDHDLNPKRSTPEISLSGGGSAIQRQLAQVLQGRRSGQGGSPQETSAGALGSRTLRLSDPMMRGEDVRQLQEKLIERGHSVGSSGADGVLGRDTEDGVKAFQTSQGIEVDGIAGPETFGKLTASAPDDPQQQEDTSAERETDNSDPESESENPSAPALEIPSEDVDIMARTLYGEARGESAQGKATVGGVTRNRTARPAWPSGIAAVCQQPWQFSCWNAGDPNLPQLRSVTTANPVFAECVEIANQVVSGSIPDVTNGADHYYANYISPPNWAKGETPVAQIGVHLFFNLTGTQQPATQNPTETDQTGDASSAGERTLRLSDPPMRGDDVRHIQEQLIGLGHSVGRYGADGVFGQNTYEAVKWMGWWVLKPVSN